MPQDTVSVTHSVATTIHPYSARFISLPLLDGGGASLRASQEHSVSRLEDAAQAVYGISPSSGACARRAHRDGRRDGYWPFCVYADSPAHDRGSRDDEGHRRPARVGEFPRL